MKSAVGRQPLAGGSGMTRRQPVLLHQLADQPAAMLNDALGELIARGVMASTTLPDGRALYAAPRPRRQE